MPYIYAISSSLIALTAFFFLVVGSFYSLNHLNGYANIFFFIIPISVYFLMYKKLNIYIKNAQFKDVKFHLIKSSCIPIFFTAGLVLSILICFISSATKFTNIGTTFSDSSLNYFKPTLVTMLKREFPNEKKWIKSIEDSIEMENLFKNLKNREDQLFLVGTAPVNKYEYVPFSFFTLEKESLDQMNKDLVEHALKNAQKYWINHEQNNAFEKWIKTIFSDKNFYNQISLSLKIQKPNLEQMKVAKDNFIINRKVILNYLSSKNELLTNEENKMFIMMENLNKSYSSSL
jgi:hypothetical protein